MLRASLGKVVHTVQRAGTFAAKVSPQELHKIAVHVRAVVQSTTKIYQNPALKEYSKYSSTSLF
jgi:hypothetical protein